MFEGACGLLSSCNYSNNTTFPLTREVFAPTRSREIDRSTCRRFWQTQACIDRSVALANVLEKTRSAGSEREQILLIPSSNNLRSIGSVRTRYRYCATRSFTDSASLDLKGSLKESGVEKEVEKPVSRPVCLRLFFRFPPNSPGRNTEATWQRVET